MAVFPHSLLVAEEGASVVFVDRYRSDDLARMADLVLEFRKRRADGQVYILLNNHYTGSSAATVAALQRLLDLPVVTLPPVA